MNLSQSFKELLETAIRTSFENQMNESFSKLEKDMRNKFEESVLELKKQIKKEAQVMAVQMLQKADINGLTLEIKL